MVVILPQEFVPRNQLLDARPGGFDHGHEPKGLVLRHVPVHCQLEILPKEATGVAVAVRMRERSLSAILVESLDRDSSDCRIVGIITEADLVRKVLAQRLDAARTTAAQVIAGPLLTIAPDRPMLDASHVMETHKVRHLVGVLSIRDLVKMVSARDRPEFLRRV